jgi:hypothetical protein
MLFHNDAFVKIASENVINHEIKELTLCPKVRVLLLQNVKGIIRFQFPSFP